MADFGDLLRELRQEEKLTQKGLAQKINVTPGTISNYEKGTYYPDVPKLLALADFFHVTVDYILGRCKQNISPEVFSEAVTDTKSVGEFIQGLQRLPLERRKALTLILDDMEILITINLYNNKEPQ